MTVKRAEGAVCVHCRPFPSPRHLTFKDLSLGLRKELSEHFARESMLLPFYPRPHLSSSPHFTTTTTTKIKAQQDLSYGNNNGPNSQIWRKFISKSSDFYDTLF
jgi:hypothetical protein